MKSNRSIPLLLFITFTLLSLTAGEFFYAGPALAQTNLVNVVSGPDPVHDYSTDKPESVIGDLGVKPVSSPTPAPKFKVGAEYKFQFKFSDSLKTETFILSNGTKISLNFPGDLSIGDRFTGTLQTELSGNDEKQRAKNLAELNKYTLSIGGQIMPRVLAMKAVLVPFPAPGAPPNKISSLGNCRFSRRYSFSSSCQTDSKIS